MTDGTLVNTGLEQDIRVGAGSSDPSSFLATPDGHVYFAANDGLHGNEPFVHQPFAVIQGRVLIVTGTDDADSLSLTFTGSNSTPGLNGVVRGRSIWPTSIRCRSTPARVMTRSRSTGRWRRSFTAFRSMACR